MRYIWLCGLVLGALPMTASAREGFRVHYGGCGYHYSSYCAPCYRGYWYPTVYVGPSYYCPPVVVYTMPAVVYTAPVTYYPVPQTVVVPAPQGYPAPAPVPAPAPENYYYGQ